MLEYDFTENSQTFTPVKAKVIIKNNADQPQTLAKDLKIDIGSLNLKVIRLETDINYMQDRLNTIKQSLDNLHNKLRAEQKKNSFWKNCFSRFLSPMKERKNNEYI